MLYLNKITIIFEPMFFFELDSIYQINQSNKKKIKLKIKLSFRTKILFRIRAQDDNYSLKEMTLKINKRSYIKSRNPEHFQ